MEKYKVCPNCGEHNSPTLMECMKCQTDLMSVKVVDAKTENVIKEIHPTTEMVRICDCGAENPSSARKCLSCGEDISDITPIAKNECSLFFYALQSIDGKYNFEIKNDCTVGRENEMQDYLQDKVYVSRNHAKLTLSEDKLYILNLSDTNFTYVNNEKIPNDVPTELKIGDEIGLGGCVKNGERQELAAYFTVGKN